jgi:diguanylate cyclase
VLKKNKSNTWIELGLSRPGPATPEPANAKDLVPTFAMFARELLSLIGDVAPEVEEFATANFRRSLGEYSTLLETSTDTFTKEIVEECIKLCRAYFVEAQAQLAERESEFSELVRMLTEMVGAIDGGQATFHEQLDKSAERLTRIVDINDIRILKRRLGIEIETLRKLGVEKRASEEATKTRFATEIERLQTRLAQSMEEASLDQLTRIANRGRFERTLNQWVRAHRSSGLPFVLAMVDVDDFKKINDNEGHQEGDRVLTEVARTLSSAFRPGDLVARYGGDEFVIMLAHSTANQALDRIKALVERLGTIRIGAKETSGTITLSVGVTEWMVEDEPSDMVQRADTAMYQSKRAGKNRVDVVRRASRSRLFQNGRPVAEPVSNEPITPVEPVEEEPDLRVHQSGLRRVR